MTHARPSQALLLFVIASVINGGCGVHGALRDFQPTMDASARETAATPDAVVPMDTSVSSPCPSGPADASAVGLSQFGRFDLRFAWVGYEHFGSHACPKLVVRFTPTRDLRASEHVDITVTYPNSASTMVLGTHMATIEHTVGDRTAMVSAPVTVLRADGLSSRFDAGVFLNSLSASLHIATWDLEATVNDAGTCPPFFAICL